MYSSQQEPNFPFKSLSGFSSGKAISITRDATYKLDNSVFPFVDELKSLFKVDELSELHNSCSDLSPFLDADLGRDSNSTYHAAFYTTIKDLESPLRRTWDSFLTQFVKPLFPEEDLLIVQALPNIRIHVPGAQAVHRWHCDSDIDHRHPLGEKNFILALTDMYESNSVWRESIPGLGDFSPFELKANDLVVWNGNTCIHGNKVNETGVTRISLNFRMIPRHLYDLSISQSQSPLSSVTTSTKFVIGSYYKTV